MPAATMRPLPGFAFETRTPVYADVLPRMDVALLVGFAASGPVNVPVPVEDAAQFEAVFGADAPLAWDVETGRVAQAQLAPAVRMFFANGGKRCWIVRVARGARSNTFAVPGIAATTADGPEDIAPLVLTARAPGSWSDGVTVSASLTARRMGALGWTSPDDDLWLAGPVAARLGTGDLIRVTWPEAGVQVYFGVASAAPVEADAAGPRRTVVARGDSCWFDLRREPGVRHGSAVLPCGSVDAEYLPPDSPPAADAEAALTLDVPVTDAPAPGTVIVATFGPDTLLLTVGAVEIAAGDSASPPPVPVCVRGRAVWMRRTAYAWPHASPPDVPAMTVERLGVDLWARTGGGDPRRIDDVGLAPGHPRHVALLPDDDTVYGAADWSDAALWRDAVSPRFPLAGGAARSAQPSLDPPALPLALPLCIPFGVQPLPEPYLAASVLDDSPIVRDGLGQFDAALFADEALATSLVPTLAADADYVRFLAAAPRPLAGLHAALPIEEVTLIAVPDAVQPGWSHHGSGLADITSFDLKPPCEDDGRFASCDALACAPVVSATAFPDAVRLTWSAEVAGPFVIERASNSEWSDAVVVFDGWIRDVTIAQPLAGEYFYRVRGVGSRPTEWSNGIAARVPVAGGWRMTPQRQYREDALVVVHRLLLRLCASRRDVMAVLSLPEHYREDAAAAYARQLGAPKAPVMYLGTGAVPPIGAGEADAPGFAALYHGWTYTREDDGALRAVAPDGPACGVIARRALTRGAWIAPANELLTRVVALDHPAGAGRWQELQQLRVNVIRQLPHGFAVMSADTLAPDEDLRPIGVRRLLILLRRVATRRGATYVFEPNDDAFRRMVQRGFEAVLGDLFERGAFAGATAATAFQVVTGDALNTPQSVDQGRFIVELRVAPSRPMTFLTLRLVQTGDRVSVTGA